MLLIPASLLLAACGGGDGSSAASGEPAEAAVASAPTEGVQGSGVAAAGEVPLTIEATVGGRQVVADGMGECRHAPEASIYGVPAAMWMVQYQGAGEVRSLSLTLWRPKSGGGDQLSLSLGMGEARRSISTVQGAEPAGSATASLVADGAGGRIRVDGRDEGGSPLRLEVRCSRFGSVEAVGG